MHFTMDLWPSIRPIRRIEKIGRVIMHWNVTIIEEKLLRILSLVCDR